jgi:epoxyqueuosine reductase
VGRLAANLFRKLFGAGSSFLFLEMLVDQIKTEAFRLGFSHCGCARAEPPEELQSFYSGYPEQGKHITLNYLKTNHEKRMDPSRVLPGVKSVITLALNYFPPETIPDEDNFIIAKYAYGSDYHIVVKNRLEQLMAYLKLESGAIQLMSFVDSGPVPEKIWAHRCGLGWQGKNTILINKKSGSFFFLGVLLTDLDLEPDTAGIDYCGDCEKCIRACPTGALDKPYQLDISRCIAFHTIENKSTIPEDVINHLHDRIYGCDICQDVCPFNRFSKSHGFPEFLPSPALINLRKHDWLALTNDQFNAIFANSPVKRIGYQRLMRNIEAAGKKSG